MSQQQPTWASPQQPDEGDPQAQPRRKRSIGKIVGIWFGSAVGLFVLLGVIGQATGAGKSTNASASTSPAPMKASAAPTPAAKTTAPAKPKPSPKSAAPAKSAAPVKVTVTNTPAPKLATADARKKAAAILEQEDQDFRDFLAQGVKVTGTPQYTAWFNKAVLGLDMKQTAFTKADAYFTADTEPTDLIEAWRSDNGDANALITQYGNDGLSPDAPDAATRKDASDCLADLAKADKDAEKIANGG